MQTSIKRYFIILVFLNTYVVTHARHLRVKNYSDKPITLNLKGLVSDGKSSITAPPRSGVSGLYAIPSETNFNLQDGTGYISIMKGLPRYYIESPRAHTDITIIISSTGTFSDKNPMIVR